MQTPSFDRLQSALHTAATFSKTMAMGMVQKMLMPYILQVFAEHDHEQLRKMIIADYALVRRKTPEGVRIALDNVGSNPELRERWEGIVLEVVTPENIKEWLRNPDEWLDAEGAEQQRERLRRCADVIEETQGGELWLEQQVLDLYAMAGLIDGAPVAETDKPAEADD